MPRLIDADVLMPNAEYKGKYDTVNAYDIVNCPTVDAEPAMLCKDCRWCEKEGQEGLFYRWCFYHNKNVIVDADYCSWGERREDENN